MAVANGHDFMLGCTIFLSKELLGNLVCSGNKSQNKLKYNQSIIT